MLKIYPFALRSSLLMAAVLGATASSFSLPAADSGTDARSPILMELFTSEGCSSCPPVDTWAADLDKSQPIRDARIIVLSEHVDYWDHDGWKDPFSSSQLTARQRDYAGMLRIGDVYTPQVILDGEVEVKRSSAQSIVQSFERAAATPMMPVRIEGAAVDAHQLRGTVEADAAAEKHGGDVYVALAIDSTETDVLAGENDGKKLTNVAVVKALAKIGKLEKGKPFQQEFRIPLWSGADRTNLRVIAFVQEPGPGRVLGAAMTKEIGSAEDSAQTR